MKILIADSGSTKTEWALLEKGGVRRIVTAGLNPVHRSAEEIEAVMRQGFTLDTDGIEALFFYGAGCIPSTCGAMGEVLRRVFATENVTVESDLSGAARGLLGRGAGVACILGTGSNSALYDGGRIVQNVPPLGYILGDEGSGADLGKRLIGSLLKGLLPGEITAAFFREYALDYSGIIEAIYRKPGAGRFLAGFSPFLSLHIDHPAVRAIVDAAFSGFVERNLLSYERIGTLPIACTGSVAFHFEKPLREVFENYDLSIGKIEKTPMDGLIRYHTQKP
jgi:N-acetylglucosamine kinase-like BadF-type ATPase